MIDFLSIEEYPERFRNEYYPTAEDWAEYCDYLDAVGVDDLGDAIYDNHDPDFDRGFQNLDSDFSW